MPVYRGAGEAKSRPHVREPGSKPGDCSGALEARKQMLSTMLMPL